MAIIEVLRGLRIVQGDGSDAPVLWRNRLVWLAGIWGASTAVLFVVAALLRLVVPR